jgi:hypothetical protein
MLTAAHLARRGHEHAQHQHHHHHRKHRAAPGAQQRVTHGAAGQRIQHLRHGQAGVVKAARPAAADEHKETHHAGQPEQRPHQHRHGRGHAYPDEVVHAQHTHGQQQRASAGLGQAHALHGVGGEQGVEQTAHRWGYGGGCKGLQA